MLNVDHSLFLELDSSGMQLEKDIVRTDGGQERKPIEATGGPGLASGGQGLVLAEAAGGGAKTSGWLSKCFTKHLFVCSLSKLAVFQNHKQNPNTLQLYVYSVQFLGQQNIV